MSLQIKEVTKDPLLKQNGKTNTITGTIYSCQEKEDKYVLEVKPPKSHPLLITVYGRPSAELSQKLAVGMGFSCPVALSRPSPRRNPGCFDYRLYLLGRNIHMLGQTTTDCLPSEITVFSTWRYRIFQVSNGFLSTMKSHLTKETYGLLTGILFGDKSQLEPALYQSFQRNGTAHILAVSGLHVAMIYGLLSLLIGGRYRVVPQLILFLLLLTYGLLAGFTPSVQRALLMIFLHILSRLLYYRYDLLSAACCSCVLQLLRQPYLLFSTGFQLSFLAIFLLAFLLPLFKNLPLSELTKNTLLPIFVIQGGMAMYTVYAFNYFSLSSFAANIPILFLAGIIVPTGIVSLLVSLCFPFILPFCAAVLQILIKAILFCNKLVYCHGRFSFDLPSPPLWLLLCFYGLLFLGTSEACRIWFLRKKNNLIFLGMTAVIFSGVLLSVFYDTSMRHPTALFIDVGQGSSIYIYTPAGRHILIDGGGRRQRNIAEDVLKPVLLKNGISHIDTAIATHKDMDHYKGLLELQKLGMIDQLITNDQGFEKGDILIEEKNFMLTAVAPLPVSEKSSHAFERTTESNEASLVLLASLPGLKILATGDIGKETEAALVASGQDLHCDVLAVPHHGSKNSSSDEFIKKTNAALAIIQVGKNNYGHPAAETLNAYKSNSIPILRTDITGAIGFSPKGYTVTID